MSLFDKNKNSRIVEKKIIFKSKNKSSSRESFLQNKETPSKYTLRSTFYKENLIPFQNKKEENHTKIIDYNENVENNTNKILKIVQTVTEREIVDDYGNQNLKNFTRNYFPQQSKNNKYTLYKNENDIYDNLSLNKKKLVNSNIQTPIKKNHYQYNLKSISQNISSDNCANYKHSSASKNSISEYSNNNKYITRTNNFNNISELDSIPSLFKNQSNINSYCYFNNNINTGTIKRPENITKFNESPYIVEKNKLYKCKNNQYNFGNTIKNKNIAFETPKKYNVLEINKTDNYFELYSCDNPNKGIIYKDQYINKKSSNNENNRNYSLEQYKKNICINNNVYTGIKIKNNNLLNNKINIF